MNEFPLTYEQAEALHSSGLISDDTMELYKQVKGGPPPTDTPEPMVPPSPAPAPTPQVAEVAPVEDAAPTPTPNPLSAATYKDRQIQIESSGDPDAVSPKGAVGLMQITPIAMRDVMRARNIDDSQYSDDQLKEMAKDPKLNVDFGQSYMQMQLDKYKDPTLAAAAYNAGPTTVDKYGGVPPYKETQDYVKKMIGGSDYQDTAENAVVAKTKADIDLIRAEGAKQREIEAQAGEILKDRQNEKQKQEALLSQLASERETAWQKYANSKIDDDRWWDEKSTGGKILTVVGGMLVGALISPGAAIGLIGGMIDRDITAQKRAIDLLGEGYKKADSLYADALKRTGDTSQAYWEARADGLKMAASRMSELSELAKSDQAKANGMLAVSEIQKQIMEMEAKANDAAMKNPRYQQMLTQQAMTGNDQALSMLDEKTQARVVRGVDGSLIGLARSPEDAQKLTEAELLKGDFQSLLDRLIQIRSDSPVSISPATLKEGGAVSSELRLKIKDLYKLGALNAQDYATLDSIVPENPFGVQQWGLADRLAKMGQQAEAAFQRQLKSRIQQFSPAIKGKPLNINLSSGG